LGSGGGSPAIPLKIARPGLAFVLVESRGKKCAFLREAVRSLGLSDVQVEHCRFGDLPARRPDLAGGADLVTIRGVTPDWSLVDWLLKPASRVFWFCGTTEGLPVGFTAEPFTAGVVGARIATKPGRQ
jgi:16S rRNA (guanine527-N7)-methyltransferase